MVGDSVVIEGVRTYVENTGSFLCQFYKKKKKVLKLNAFPKMSVVTVRHVCKVVLATIGQSNGMFAKWYA